MFGVGRNFLIEENLAQRIVNFFFIVQFHAYGRDEAIRNTSLEKKAKRFIMKYQIFIKIKYNMIFCGQ